MEARKRNGHLHPITHVIRDIYSIFSEIGFGVATGPEIETEFYNFDALNIPKDHPSRDMQDTFWLRQPKSGIRNQESAIRSERLLLRTHTSPVQIRFMETHTLPFKIIVPGKVFRNEATDATHEAQFFQIEGLSVGEKVSLAELKGTLEYFFNKFLGDESRIRFRPSFFPFVRPGVEVDVFFRHRWLEVMGAGMVHPKVFDAAGVDSKKWRGFAFGGGIDRLVLLKYGIPDVRLLYSGDLRLINQF